MPGTRSPNEPERSSSKGRRSTQRERLLAAMVTAANRDGYSNTSVSSVIANAGVSRPTFYDYFADKQECFLAAIADVQARLVQTVRGVLEREPPEHAAAGAIKALLSFATADPALARFLTNEPMAGGPHAMHARDVGIAEIEQLIEERYGALAPDSVIPDLSLRAMIGGVYRLLASRLRRGERGLAAVTGDLLSWISSYEQPGARRRWRTLEPLRAPERSPFLPPDPFQSPPALANRRGIAEEDVLENHRQRIMFAAARLVSEHGYSATTIAEITRSAGVDGRVFYTMCADKQDAFMAIHELGFQQVMAVTATAFFSGASWLERNWEAGRAFTQFLEANPLVAHVGFVEAYAVGPGAVQRVEDSHLAFAMLLQEGYQDGTLTPPRLVLEAIITTIFEIVYRETRAVPGTPALSGLLGHLSFLVTAPFSGWTSRTSSLTPICRRSRSGPTRRARAVIWARCRDRYLRRCAANGARKSSSEA